jgi:hypothetical protein
MILTNTTDGRKVFVLAHDTYCRALGRCACVRALPLGRSRALVLSLEEGERRAVSSAVLSVPTIARAVLRGRLRLERAAARKGGV